MSIATEITRLQGIKTDIRNALVTQGISQAISHNMTDFSADILAIEGGGGEGVYITVVCDSVYQGYDIILSANESELDRKQCPSSLVVNLFVSADDVTLPATFTISNSLNGMTTILGSDTVIRYGWYETTLKLEFTKIFDGIHTHTSYTGYKNFEIINYINTEYLSHNDGTITALKNISNVKVSITQTLDIDEYYVYKNSDIILTINSLTTESIECSLNAGDTIKIYRATSNASNDKIQLVINAII